MGYKVHANQVLCYLCILIYCMKHIPDVNCNAIIYTIIIANMIVPPCIFSKQDTDNSAVYEESQMGNLSKLFQQPLLMYTYTLEKNQYILQQINQYRLQQNLGGNVFHHSLIR